MSVFCATTRSLKDCVSLLGAAVSCCDLIMRAIILSKPRWCHRRAIALDVRTATRPRPSRPCGCDSFETMHAQINVLNSHAATCIFQARPTDRWTALSFYAKTRSSYIKIYCTYLFFQNGIRSTLIMILKNGYGHYGLSTWVCARMKHRKV